MTVQRHGQSVPRPDNPPVAAPGDRPISAPSDRAINAPIKLHASLRLLRRYADAVGDLGFAQIGGRRVVLVNSGRWAREVLVARRREFVKSPFQREMVEANDDLGEGLGNGIFTSPDSVHADQRRVIAKVFRPQRFGEAAARLAEAVDAEVAQWTRHDLDLTAAMMRITTGGVGRYFFSTDFGPDRDEVVAALGAITGSDGRAGIKPTEDRRAEVAWATACVRGTVERLARRRADDRGRGLRPEGPGDLVDVLLDAALLPPSGAYLVTDQQVRDELVTVLITGTENTRNALVWSWLLLMAHPEVYRQVRDEARAVLDDGRAASLTDLAQLPWATQVYQEALRLFPPGYAFSRRAVRDVDLGGLAVPTGTDVLISPFLLHRRADLFPDPDDFVPERFAPSVAHLMPPDAYLPFGLGHRACIGAQQAMALGPLVLAAVAARVRFDPVDSAPVVATPFITLRPAAAIRVRVSHGADSDEGDEPLPAKEA